MKRYYLLLTLSILSFPLRAAKPICNYNEGLSSTSNDFFGETDARISLPSDREEQWWEALERGDICQIKRMLTQFSIDPNKENKDGWNPLVIAASKGYTNICQELVAHGADPNQGRGYAWKIALPSKKIDKDGCPTQLYICPRWERCSCLPESANTAPSRASSFYLEGLYLESKQTLGSSGFSSQKDKSYINEGDECKSPPLFFAARDGYIETCKYLLESMNVDRYEKNKYRWVLLYIAVREGDIQMCRHLLENTDIHIYLKNKKANRYKWTPLHTAVENNHTKMCEYLLRNVVNINVNQRTYGGYTPLCTAVNNGNEEMCELLIRYGADVNQASKGWFFISKEVYPGQWEKRRYSPLRLAAENRYERIYDLLIKAGANRFPKVAGIFTKEIRFNPEATKKESSCFLSKIREKVFPQKMEEGKQPLLFSAKKRNKSSALKEGMLLAPYCLFWP